MYNNIDLNKKIAEITFWQENCRQNGVKTEQNESRLIPVKKTGKILKIKNDTLFKTGRTFTFNNTRVTFACQSDSLSDFQSVQSVSE